ncbi:unnamed protein product [Lampetra fluviatilis]
MDGERLRELSTCIMELLYAVTVLMGQLGKEEPVERAATRWQQTGDSTVTADQGWELSPAEFNLPLTASLGMLSLAQQGHRNFLPSSDISPPLASAQGGPTQRHYVFFPPR